MRIHVKKILVFGICALLLCPSTSYAKTLKKTESYTTTNRSIKKGFSGSFDKKIVEDDITYKREKITYTCKKKTSKVTGEQVVTTTQSRAGLTSKNYSAPNQITKGGVTYTLQSTTFSQTGGKSTKSFTKTVTGTSKKFPSKKSFTVSGNGITKRASLSKKKTSSKESWVSGESYTITVKDYEKGSFYIGGKKIYYSASSPGIGGESALVLKQLGLSTTNYKMSSAGWSGKEYKSGSSKCRNISVHTSKKRVTYTATYGGQVTFDSTRYTARSSYQGTKKTKETIYHCIATAYYKKTKTTSQTAPPEETPISSEAPTMPKNPISTQEPTNTPVATDMPLAEPTNVPSVAPSPIPIVEEATPTPNTEDMIVSTEDYRAKETPNPEEEGQTIDEVVDDEEDDSTETKSSVSDSFTQYIPMIVIFGVIIFGCYMAYKKFMCD